MYKQITKCVVGAALTLMAMNSQAAAPIKAPATNMAYGIELYSVTPSTDYRGAYAGFAQYGDYSLIVGVPAYVNIDKKYQYGYDTNKVDYEEIQTPVTLRVEKPLQKGLEWVADLEYVARRIENTLVSSSDPAVNPDVKSWTYAASVRLGLAQKLSQNVKILFLPQLMVWSPNTLAENKHTTSDINGHYQSNLSGTKVALKYTL